MKTLMYDQTVDIVDQFMEKSGIRKYCTDVCNGKCCKTCRQNSPECCMITGDTRLSCTIYLCNFLAKLIFSQREYRIFYKIQAAILTVTYKYRQKDKGLRSMYCYLPRSEIKNEKFPMYIYALNKFNLNRIKEKLKQK